jgi:polyisoprenyl-phosphate glycosyltransferase
MVREVRSLAERTTLPRYARILATGPEYSIVIPVLNERETLDALFQRLTPVMEALDGPCEVILVDDGSTDGSVDVMLQIRERDSRFTVVRLSRNFGHQIAISAGLDYARGNAVVVMDADLQDPPEVVLELAKKWREGHDVVYAQRDERAGESKTRLAITGRFYRLLAKMSEVPIPLDTGDFRLVDRRALDAVKSMPEHRRYLRGMFSWVGYDQVGVSYARDARHAGHTKYPYRKLVRLATDGLASFSTAPLRLALNIGFAVSILSFLAGIVTVALRVFGVVDGVPGWASIAVGVTFLSGIQLTVLGVMGEYIARIHDEVKQRPLYFVRDVWDADGRDQSRPSRSRLTAESTDA